MCEIKTASVTSSCKLDESNSDDFVIYPNPNSGDFSIQLSSNSGTAKEINITIYSATGAVVYEANYTTENSVINQDINLGNGIATGMYLVKISNGNTTLNKTLVIE
ncbi:MAG: T9SS type A sorting domain-containing protein [Bacteroidetes bacterium]|nr:T9SS type A sorting domain-containing protein [Bacteroidota bacterium]